MKGKKQCCWGNCNVQTSQDFTWRYNITIMCWVNYNVQTSQDFTWRYNITIMWWLGAHRNHTLSFCTSQDVMDLSTKWWHQKDQNMPPECMTWLVEWRLVTETEKYSTGDSLQCCHVTASDSMEVFHWFLLLLWQRSPLQALTVSAMFLCLSTFFWLSR